MKTPELNPKRWKPNEGDGWWFVTDDLRTVKWSVDVCTCGELYNVGNCFPTRSVAQEVADKFKLILVEAHRE